MGMGAGFSNASARVHEHVEQSMATGVSLMSQVVHPLRILQISGADMGWSPSNIAWGLFRAYQTRGHVSRLAVGTRHWADPDVRAIPAHSRSDQWARAWKQAGDALVSMESKIPRGVGPLGRLLHEMAHPEHVLNRWQGIEDFDHPGSWRVLDLWSDRPDVVQLHNLYAGYFDLRLLPWLSSQVPVILTLHDAWLLSGHCAASLSCERWKIGCGHCPDLTLHPAVRRDATADNWQRKREIYRSSRLHVAAPSEWLMRRVEESMLMEGTVDLRVIPHGVDLTVFRPAVKEAVRRRLGLPVDAKILLFVAMLARTNKYKDYPTVRDAGLRVAEHLQRERILVITLGETAAPERVGNAEFRFIPPQHDPSIVASYYQAADVYVHAAHSETQSLALVEAMACGTPAVATAVGGVPEVIEDGRTGFLVPHRDSRAMADRIEELLADQNLREKVGRGAVERARLFDLNRQADSYLQWFSEICAAA